MEEKSKSIEITVIFKHRPVVQHNNSTHERHLGLKNTGTLVLRSLCLATSSSQ